MFPMERAKKEFAFSVKGFENVDCFVLNYPMTVLRLNGEDKDEVCRLSAHILECWRGYSDVSAFIVAETDGVRHNTITPIARMKNGRYEIDLVLRNNITTAEHPLGVYHPHAKLHHIKKENIGLIEVMGLAILPGRLKTEMKLLKEAIIAGKDLRADERLAPHADWAEEFLVRCGRFDHETADGIIRTEIGRVFEEVLEDAGVYKCTQEGRKALQRFIDIL